MHEFIGRHRVLTPTDHIELALGTVLDLWLGEDGETSEERAGREAAARDILADDPSLYTRSLGLAADLIGRTMPEVLTLAPAPRPAVPVRRVRRARRKGMAA